MKLPSLESASRAAFIYTGLKTILTSVGLGENAVLLVIAQYISLVAAFHELIEEECNYFYPVVVEYSKEILIRNFQCYRDYIDRHKSIEKINSLCSINIGEQVQEYQKRIVNKICAEHITGNYTKDSLFITPSDNLKLLCVILGDAELCSEVIL